MIKKKVYFEKINNTHVFCSEAIADSDDKKILIMCHGFRGSSTGSARQFVDFERILNKESFSVLRFDQPNSANSWGDFIDSSFTEWIHTIVYFAKKYLNAGYKVSLFGHSMGATATVVASNNSDIKGKISCLLLWVPDAKTTIDVNPNEIYEEGGQKYKGKFWQEAKESNFFQCLKEFQGGIHLVYGETDKYVQVSLMMQTIDIVKSKNQQVMVLKDQNHSLWEYDLVQNIYKEEMSKLKECMR